MDVLYVRCTRWSSANGRQEQNRPNLARPNCVGSCVRDVMKPWCRYVLSAADQTGSLISGIASAWRQAARSSRSAIQTLIMDWRVTPSRRASRSSDSIIHTGKSTLTRRCSNPGRRIAARSRSPVTSSPSSNFWSNSSALIQCPLLLPCPAGRDDPYPLLPVGDHRRPVPVCDLADYQPPGLVSRAGGNLRPHGVVPERLNLGEVDAVLLQIRGALGRVELELHPIMLLSV